MPINAFLFLLKSSFLNICLFWQWSLCLWGILVKPCHETTSHKICLPAGHSCSGEGLCGHLTSPVSCSERNSDCKEVSAGQKETVSVACRGALQASCISFLFLVFLTIGDVRKLLHVLHPGPVLHFSQPTSFFSVSCFLASCMFSGNDQPCLVTWIRCQLIFLFHGVKQCDPYLTPPHPFQCKLSIPKNILLVSP